MAYSYLPHIPPGPGRRVVLALLLPLVLATCTQTADQPGAASENEALHALMIDRIDTLHRRIDILTFDRDRTPLALDRARQRGSEEVALAARELSASVGLLEQAGESLGLDSREAQQFRALANELRGASDALAEAAADPEAELGPALDNLQQSCDTCHALYRGR